MAKVWKVPVQGSLKPYGLPYIPSPYLGSVRLFSLFKQEDNGRWTRISMAAYPNRAALIVFGERMTNSGYMLREVKDKDISFNTAR